MAPKRTDGRDVQVEFSPTAWRQVGALPWESFNRIRNALGGIEVAENEGPRQRLKVDLGGWVAVCDVDEERKVLTVLGLVKEKLEHR